MDYLFIGAAARRDMELYSEYLKKIPQLLSQLASVEAMHFKALKELAMLKDQPSQGHSAELYKDRLTREKTQCEARMADIKDQLALIFSLKIELEENSPALKILSAAAPKDRAAEAEEKETEDKMELLDTMLTRRSIRKYTDEPVSKDDMDKILAAGLSSPTGKGTYPWGLIVVQDKETLEKMSHSRVGAAKMLEGAAAAIVVVSDAVKTDTWVEDGSIVLTNMHLMAHALGLGSCWIQGKERFAEDERSTDEFLRDLLGYPENFRLVATLSIGHPDQTLPAHTMEGLCWDRVHYGKF